MARPIQGLIDTDVHVSIPDARVLLPHLEPYWREHVQRRGLERENFDTTAYPTGAPINARPDWKPDKGPPAASLERLQADLLDRYGHRAAILNVIHGAQAMFSEDLSLAFCRAINNYIAAEWLAKDKRLRASIVVPPHSAELAAEEVERLAGDDRYVQVLTLAMSELPLGRRQHWPLYRVAEKHGLPIGIHAGSSFRHPPSAGGWGSLYLEDYVSYSQGFAAALNSMITEGVFVKFPALKVVLIESGVTWLPASLWRLDKTWRGVRAETPWLEEQPAHTVRRNVRLTLQPFDAPPTAAQVQKVLEQLNSEEMLMFSSDYPHWHYDGDDAIPDGMPDDLIRKICIDNPLNTYPRLKETTS
ncbi:MAG TPA: amidohydrolase family protein [Rhodopila sp.]|uniref:amidohydrolase family protein n=1 Tax=Rhodopila sp. TaxID=2480087 RepID=UPI002C5EC3F5|nr:amidohydrolase family protein [Rhodopila sp.]HVY14756.1 amidohydrolase family protein [Rhodopila sp.]